jgi:hypothetical protein
MIEIDHKVYGKIFFQYEVEEESECVLCVHINVCHNDMSQLCINHERNDSQPYYPESCKCCTHYYSSHDSGRCKKVKCFVCRHEIPVNKIDKKGFSTWQIKNSW